MQLRSYKILNISLLCIFLFISDVSAQILKKAIPDHLIVLTFDDATRSDYSFIAPILNWKHISVNKLTPEQFRVQVKYIENKCEALKIPKPVSFAYPAW